MVLVFFFFPMICRFKDKMEQLDLCLLMPKSFLLPKTILRKHGSSLSWEMLLIRMDSSYRWHFRASLC